jgi:hypothetical protein
MSEGISFHLERGRRERDREGRETEKEERQKRKRDRDRDRDTETERERERERERIERFGFLSIGSIEVCTFCIVSHTLTKSCIVVIRYKRETHLLSLMDVILCSLEHTDLERGNISPHKSKLTLYSVRRVKTQCHDDSGKTLTNSHGPVQQPISLTRMSERMVRLIEYFYKLDVD